MRQKHRTNAPGWAAKVAAEFGVDDRTARRWKRAGCPADLTKLRGWLASRRQLPVAAITLPKTDKPAPAATDTEQQGAAPALTRMARQELANWRTLQAAIESGDPLAVKTAHQQWLATADTLRRLDLAVEVARRDSGQLLPVAELKRAFSMLLLGVRLSLSKHGDGVANDALVAGVLPLLNNEQDRWLHDSIRAEVWSWIADCPEHLRRALCLYVECLAAFRSCDVPPALAEIVSNALARITTEPPAKDTRPQ